MKPYEAIIIFNPAVTEDKIDVSVSKFEKKIKDSGGVDVITAKWGMRKLASQVKKAKKATEGYYVLINFNGEGATPNELRSLLDVSEEIIRYSVICSRPAQPEPKEEKVEIEPSMIMPPIPSTEPNQEEASA
ncbi:MAG: 30S ribosomal protein S6 [bacterium]